MTIEVLDANGDPQTIATLDDLIADLGVTRFYRIAGSPLIRPANTTLYDISDSISDNATAGSVTPNVVSRGDRTGSYSTQPFTVEAITLSTDDTGVAAVEALFEVFLFRADPSAGVGAGDNATYSQTRANFLGRYSGTFTGSTGYFSDGAVARLIPASGENRTIIKPGTGLTNIWWQPKTLTAIPKTPMNKTSSFLNLHFFSTTGPFARQISFFSMWPAFPNHFLIK